jgi:hypothetical protein
MPLMPGVSFAINNVWQGQNKTVDTLKINMERSLAY